MIGLLLVCGQTVWRIKSVMPQCLADLRGLGGKYVCVAWRKRDVSLVSGMTGGIT